MGRGDAGRPRRASPVRALALSGGDLRTAAAAAAGAAPMEQRETRGLYEIFRGHFANIEGVFAKVPDDRLIVHSSAAARRRERRLTAGFSYVPLLPSSGLQASIAS